MTEHIAFDLEVDALHHLIQVGLKQSDARFRPLVLSLHHKVIHQLVLGVCLGLEEAGSDDLLIDDGYILAGEQCAATHTLIKLRNLHPGTAAERVKRSRCAEIPLERGSHIRVLVDIPVYQFVECRR